MLTIKYKRHRESQLLVVGIECMCVGRMKVSYDFMQTISVKYIFFIFVSSLPIASI